MIGFLFVILKNENGFAKQKNTNTFYRE